MSDPKDKKGGDDAGTDAGDVVRDGVRNDEPDDDPDDDADLTAEIRRGRAFDLAEAVGREAGGALKGASPVAPDRQLLLAIDALLEAHLADSEGTLGRTILARLRGDPPLLGRHPGRPGGALREFLDRVLAHRTALADLVREVDARWGRDYGERPRFETPGRDPAPDDPYTVAGVGDLLRALRAALADTP